MLRRLFNQAARGLPLGRLSEVRRPLPALDALASSAPASGAPAVADFATVGAERARRRYGGSAT
jgi:hypothetical protein